MKTITLEQAYAKASKRIGRNIPPISHYPIIYGDDAPNHVHVAQIITRGIPPEVAEVNASLICHAFNVLPEVVKALKEAQDLILVARKHFSKRMTDTDKFKLELVNAQLGKALSKANQVQLPD